MTFSDPRRGRPAICLALDGWPKRTIFGNLPSFIHRTCPSRLKLSLIIAPEMLSLILPHKKSSFASKVSQTFSFSSTSFPATVSRCTFQILCKSRVNAVGRKISLYYYHYYRKFVTASNRLRRTTICTFSTCEEPITSNIHISTGHMVLAYMEDHLRNRDRLEQEWEGLCTYEPDPNSTIVASKPENAPKNRVPDVLPYDHNRVILSELANASGSDYINASTITDHDPRNPAYIATQGPLPMTVTDFWQLVWEQGSVVLVLLTRLSEHGEQLCYRYWPEEGSQTFHIYEVHLVSEHIWCDDYLVRSFYLKNLRTGETRTVTQFHFLSWTEGGIPISAKSLLEFRRKVNKSYRGRSCPIIVHCSDGAGRAGTYCLIDMVLNRISKGAKEIDIAATLEHLRDQRIGMVRTRQQFEFVLKAVAEEVHAILRALPQ
nr:EOG090X01LO [Artemia franciscana]